MLNCYCIMLEYPLEASRLASVTLHAWPRSATLASDDGANIMLYVV